MMATRPGRFAVSVVPLGILLAALLRPVAADEPIDGFVAPYRTVEVATAESGVVAVVLVEQGQRVEAGEPLARLDDDLHAAIVEIAEKSMQAEGQLIAAEAERRVRQERLAKLEELLARGSARPEEVQRARADAAIADAQLQAIKEDLVLKRLDYRRAQLQWKKRTINSPLAGVVLQVHKEPGEYIGAGDPRLVTIVQLDPLLAVFPAPSRIARKLQVGQTVSIHINDSQTVVPGTVEFVAPVVDGRSGTMRVEVRLDNREGKLLSGVPCMLVLTDETTSG